MNTTTKLEAVNAILATIGESPLAALPATDAEDILATTTLDEVCREFQTEGWSFNTNLNKVFTPDGSGEIVLSSSTVKVRVPDDQYYDENPAIRDGKLYNRRDNTTTFTRPLTLHEVILLDFDQLPEPARRYVCVRAARLFQSRALGAQVIHAITERDEHLAKQKFEVSETDADQPNFLRNPMFAHMFRNHY